ncbi:glycogen/starch/alpha-glucan family phosphorylase [Enterobacter sp. C4G1]|uniref:glycogen/starch/alpha-glucan family phosphorylase n=1 Tax=Enterobacter sp. C4G1 TaxID=3458724 RepID=UPI004068DD49
MQNIITHTSHHCDIEALKKTIIDKLLYTVGKDPVIATNREWLNATLYAVRDQLVERWHRSNRAQFSQDERQVYYLSMEFLIGRTLSNAMLSLGIYDEVKSALDAMGLDLEELIDEENDPGLGNGGLGRLAACFLDSLATQGLPGCGYGIRYNYGMFRQNIIDGRQKETPDYWLEYGNPWEFKRHNTHYKVRFGGRIQQEGNISRWIDTEEILAVAHDQIIPGYKIDTTNTLRLWNVQVNSEINAARLAQEEVSESGENTYHYDKISRVLYPDDSTEAGRELRLRQAYFLASATIQDILNRHYMLHKTYDNLAEKIAIHLNDTHPVLSIPELMRVLIDDHNFSWDKAWDVTCQIFSYTNHTLMSEALETWPVAMLSRILPRHLQIIFDINERFLNKVREQHGNDGDLLRRVSLVDESHGRVVRMAWLAVVMSYKVNGVSELHSDLMSQSLFADFARIFPTRFTNVTNGVTARRWLALANPSLATVLDTNIGPAWRTDLNQLSELKWYIDYPSANSAIYRAKRANKKRLADYIATQFNIVVNPGALFDVQVKRIHEYKRQLMNVLHIISRYNRIKANPEANWVPRVNIFAGKAASSYYMAKQIIHLINDVAQVVNNDPQIGGKLKVVFIPDYSVSLAQMIIPAADLSEQISLAGTEASGTSNMKFALNGALTIGTLDGANIEMREHVGAKHFFIFGNTAQQVEALRCGGYNPHKIFEQDEELRQILTQIGTGHFSPQEPERYRNLLDSLINFGDHYQVLADYRSYVECQNKVDQLYRHPAEWTSSAMHNIANMGYFSSDRAIQEYADNIWHIGKTRL